MTEYMLPKLILMLSSENDNEVVTAARKIDVMLRKAGKDWHWLANKVGGKPASTTNTASKHGYTQPAEPPPNPDMADDEFEEAIQKCAANRGRFTNQTAREFIDDMAERYEKYGRRMWVSPKQRDWLIQLAGRI